MRLLGFKLDEKVKRLKEANSALRVQLKAKGKEIVELNKSCELHYRLMISGERRGVQKGISKARSIVAMLFWEYKKKVAQYGKHALITGSSYGIFQKACKILKETK